MKQRQEALSDSQDCQEEGEMSSASAPCVAPAHQPAPLTARGLGINAHAPVRGRNDIQIQNFIGHHC